MKLFYEIIGFIRIDILGGIIIYSIFFFILKPFFSNKNWLIDTDNKVIGFILDISILTLISSILIVAINHFLGKNQNDTIPLLFQLIIWFGIVNLFRINFFKRFLITRVLIGLLASLDITILAVFIASMNSYSAWKNNRGFPSTWFDTSNINISYLEIIIGITLKICILVSLSYLYHFLKEKFNLLKKK